MADEPDTSEKAPRTWLGLIRRFSRLWGFALFLAFLVVLFRQIVLPFIFAILIAYLLAPVVRRMQPKTGRAGAVIILYLIILSALVGFFGFLLPGVVSDLSKLRETAPDAIAKINEEWVPQASAWLDDAFGDLVPAGGAAAETSQAVVTPQPDGSYVVDLENVRLRVEEQGDGGYLVEAPTPGGENIGEIIKHLVASKGSELTDVVGSAIQSFLAGVVSFFTSFVITFMLAAFILVDIERVNRFVRSLVPDEFTADYDQIVKGVDVGIAGVIRGQLLICLINGVLTYIGLLIFGVKYSLLLALVAGVFSLIPIFGTILSSIPIVLVALVSGDEGLALGKGVAMIAWIAGIHLIEANFLNPKIIGDSAKIHPVIVVFALLAGEYAYGLTGALLAVPTASIIQTVFLYARSRSREVFERRQSEVAIKPLVDQDAGPEEDEGS